MTNYISLINKNFMIDLNDDQLIASIDKSNMLSSIEALPDQCQQAWEEVSVLQIPASYQKINQVVVSGMGGSALGSHIFYSLFFDLLKVSFQIVNDYHLPASVSQKTLVLLSSYSGTTEETLSCAKEALKRKAKVIGITTGNLLGSFLTNNHLPGYIFKPKYNPCNQPRMGLGYSILGQIALFSQCGLIKLKNTEATNMVAFLKKEKEAIKNKARLMAEFLINKIPIIVSANFLSGNAHALANQINENSKAFSFYYLLPELNHHLLESLKNPQAVNKIAFLFINSNLYDNSIAKRLKLTKQIILKNQLVFSEFNALGSNRLEQVFSCLLFGCYTSFYLSILYYQNPSLIPWVDYFKDQLKKSH